MSEGDPPGSVPTRVAISGDPSTDYKPSPQRIRLDVSEFEAKRPGEFETAREM